MKRILALGFTLALTGTAWAGEINDLSAQGNAEAPIFAGLPLGLPEFLWWTIAVLGAACAVAFLARIGPHWLAERCREPSTHVALAVFLACGGLFVSSFSLDPSPVGQGLLLSAVLFAFLGLIGKDKEGPLL